MELYLDTADAKVVAELSSIINVSGVTTNPTIITRSGKRAEQVVDEMLNVLSPEQKLFCQVIPSDAEGMLADARRIMGLREHNMAVKIPVTHEGLRAIKMAKAEGMEVLATAIYAADQAFLAAMNGADWLAPYVNRMCAYGDGVAQVAELIDMLAINGMDAKVIGASFKNTLQVHELMLAGIQAITIPPEVAYGLIDHPGTDKAVAEFTSAWAERFDRQTFLAKG